ncbi:MAG: hypothetical protein WDN75_11900 [Bacteroidota bacterium]
MNLSYFWPTVSVASKRVGLLLPYIQLRLLLYPSGCGFIVSFLIMEGFQTTIKNRIYSFSANILITKLSLNNSMEEQPFSFDIDLYKNPEKFGQVSHVQEFSHKPGLIKGENDVLEFSLRESEGALIRRLSKEILRRASSFISWIPVIRTIS